MRIAPQLVVFLGWNSLWPGKEIDMTDMEIVQTSLRRYTFESSKMRQWVEDNCVGSVLNLFAGKTLLSVNEIRNDLDLDMAASHHMDALDFVLSYDGRPFDTVILDPPYSYRKSMEMYNGNLNSKFKLIADNLGGIVLPTAKIISFGYHSTFMGKKRGFLLEKMCVFAHGGAQHCTIAIVESKHKDL